MNTYSKHSHSVKQNINPMISKSERAEYGDGKIYKLVQLPESGIIDKPYNTLWGDPSPGIPKQLVYGGHRILENVPFKISKTNTISRGIDLVYFINTQNCPGYIHIMSSQLGDLVRSGLLEYAKLHVCITCNEDQDVKGDVLNIVPNASVETSHINTYEYPGIRKVWDLANKYPNRITLYFHSKGITHIPNPHKYMCRTYTEKILFHNLITQWKKIIDVFDTFSNINICASICSEKGFPWFNFWWVRNRFIVDYIIEPVITKDRHYYELWLSQSRKDNCNYNPNQLIDKVMKYRDYFNDIYNVMASINIGSCSEGDVERQFLNNIKPRYNDCG